MLNNLKRFLKEIQVMSVKKKEEQTRPRVYVVGGGFEYIRLMFTLGCDGAKGIEDADIVLFTGGEDVNPELYGEAPMPKTNYNRLRDEKEQLIYKAALERELPMVGICRGGQFLNVMNGGKLWQHVVGHTGNHIARIEVPPFKNNKRRAIEVTSTHHQMMIPTEDAIMLATADSALEKHAPALSHMGKKDDDVEVVFYKDTSCLCFQPHPEFHSAPPECVDFFEECLDNWIFPNIPNRMVQMIHNQGSVTPR
jgi:gamma-glutamyl-gamma-aminobutyrate hydrolase PuuD